MLKHDYMIVSQLELYKHLMNPYAFFEGLKGKILLTHGNNQAFVLGSSWPLRRFQCRRTLQLQMMSQRFIKVPFPFVSAFVCSTFFLSFSGCNVDITLAELLSHRVGLQDDAGALVDVNRNLSPWQLKVLRWYQMVSGAETKSGDCAKLGFLDVP